MTRQKLADFGQHLSSRSRARSLRERVVAMLDNPTEDNHITVDLDSVQSISDSFADEFFAVLIQQRGEEWFRSHVTMTNASYVVRAAILRAIQSRLEPQSVPVNDGRAYELTPPPPALG